MTGNRKFIAVLLTGVLLALVIISAGCVTQEKSQTTDDRPVAVCTNGIFVGTHEDETGVVTFKGIPFAKQPVGDLRWKAPQPAEPSNEVFEAVDFGPSAVQSKSGAEKTSLREQSEACLTLDLWTKNMDGDKKPVMVFIHGGSYAFGGSADSQYSGQYLTAAHENLILVSVNYRVNLLGYIDFSRVEGGEEFPDSGYLGVLDVIEALKWIKENISAFGGDPENVTIFGESAGGGTVGCLLVSKPAEGLFQRAILQSGDASLTYPIEKFEKNMQTEYLMKITGAKNMNDLMALSTEDIQKALETDTGKTGPEGNSQLAGLNNHPMRGNDSIIPEDPYEALADGASKDVDIMIGTTADEWRYWIECMYTNLDPHQNLDKMVDKYYPFIQERAYDILGDYPEKDELIKEFLKMENFDGEKYSDKYPHIWNYADLNTEQAFRLPAIKTAEEHLAAGGKGKTYMYLFEKGVTDEVLEIMGACHAVEIPYVFNNPIGYEDLGAPDKNLLSDVSSAWVNFAATGDPGHGWTEYNTETRPTMIFGGDGTLKMEDDPKSEARILLMPLFENKIMAWGN